MKHYHVKAPCGAIVNQQFNDEPAFNAYLAKLTKDHEKDGPGCAACQPDKWVVPRTEQPADGSSLLDPQHRTKG
jgi:hypothetical protein